MDDSYRGRQKNILVYSVSEYVYKNINMLIDIV